MAEDSSKSCPPWAEMSIIGIAGSSGSGKSSVAVEIVNSLNLPGALILVMEDIKDHFYKELTPEQNKLAHADEWDFDSPNALDFDVMVEILRDLKQGRRVEIPIYSFAKHQREPQTTPLYPPRVLILEGILAFNDERIRDMLDLKIFVEADMDVCLGRRLLRDVQERGRTIESVIRQWFRYVKPAYSRYVEPQRNISDIIIPRGIENRTAIDMVVKHIQRILKRKVLPRTLSAPAVDYHRRMSM